MTSTTRLLWAKNALLAAVCLIAVGSLAFGLLPADRKERPRSFSPGRLTRADFGAVVQQIDDQFADRWKTAGLQAAARADDLTIARRLSLGLTGTIPSLEEIRELENTPAGQRMEWWVSHLLEDRRYADFVAERLARAFVGVDDGAFLVYRRRRFVTWLSDRLFENDLRYDQLVRKLIAGEGLWTDSPQVNFLTVALDQNNKNQPDPIRLGGRTVRAFLGMRIDCLQCHDEFRLDGATGFPGPDGEEREGTQRDFHRLAAYFGQASSSLRGMREDPDREYRYKYLYEDEEEQVEPAPPYLPELASQQKSRRAELASWVTHPQNKPFARATVNRIWAILVGRPLHEPIDNIPLHGSSQPGLELLTDDFIAHGFDLRRLIRLIAATRVYQIDSRADFEVTPAHEAAYAVFPLTRLRPEQAAGAVIQASSLTTIDAASHIVSQLIMNGETNDFVQRYGDMGEDEFTDRGGTIPQRLLMMNGKLVRERTHENLLQAATQISALAPDDDAAVETAFLSVLTRLPTAEETALFAGQLKGQRKKARNAQLEDLYWVLINSTEFCWNH
ncbi:DUF1553 domain-containing protein [Lignipirellula cremea]|uniref:Cytochrome c domain-containing protein n=1 Tax=Lignipirellula cremea TaxID=2528010 RepID=A0A518E2S5_9BACT|nr:DUF1553 domain-containing protein [Lignipirellula cremea]QDU98391.1 hypothetical protein Pla8534_62590 [Lignipirellula cremea]